MNNVRLRFAPSPTGKMQAGNLRTALFNYLFAKSQGGKFILRIEDTDKNRYVDGAVANIINTLNQAGIIPDEGPNQGGEFGPYIQSERLDIYQKYAKRLIDNSYAYYCFCPNNENITHELNNKHQCNCKNLSIEEINQKLKNNVPYVIRQKIPQEGQTSFNDVIHGTITINNNELEEQILIKSDGYPTYNFANVIDDHFMHISHVMRGVEFITSTPKYILLYEYFGWEPPIFIHLASVMGKNSDGSISKLSKRHGAVNFQDLINQGYLSKALINYIALLGWSPKNSNQEIFSMDELIQNFTLDGLSKSSSIFDYNKLDWFNKEYIKRLTDEEFLQLSQQYFKNFTKEQQLLLVTSLKSRITKFTDINYMIQFLYQLPKFDINLFNNKKNKVNIQNSKEIISFVINELNNINAWNIEKLHQLLINFSNILNLKLGTIIWPIRIALSMQQVTPCGVIEVLYLLGKNESLKRLNYSLEELNKYKEEN